MNIPNSLVPLPLDGLTRRAFLKAAGVVTGGLLFGPPLSAAESKLRRSGFGGSLADLPKGPGPAALVFAHFPDRVHAFVWRNWQLVPVTRMAEVLGAKPAQVRRLGRDMGLPQQPRITPGQQRRSYLTVIRRNWHLLPYGQLLQLLDWTPEEMAFALREDDFLFIKLGSLKPECEPLVYSVPSSDAQARTQRIHEIIRREFAPALGQAADPLFAFVNRLSAKPSAGGRQPPAGRFSPRFCYSYFALYGDPLLDRDINPYPDGYLAQLSQVGVTGVWLQAVLQKLAPYPWDALMSARHEERLASLRQLVQRAGKHGIGVYLYLNEPRSMPLSFYEKRPDLKGVVQGAHATLCTSHPEVQQWLTDSVATISRAVPGLAGFFTITASENLTNCWSHMNGVGCPRCGKRPPSEVIAEVNGLIHRGIQQAGSQARLIAWDWGWPDDWAEPIIQALPRDVALMSVSEWSIPIERGGVANRVGEYSISTIGPGPRARKHWELARRRGLKTLAKIQAGNTWELSAVPYIPALENVARHAANLLDAQIDGLMLGWTLGGYPSPNLEIVTEMAQADPQRLAAGAGGDPSALVRGAMERVALRRFGPAIAPAVVQAWREFSAAFSEFPFDGGLVYNAPMQYGPSNLLWAEPTGYRATMIGFPYDDLDGWRGPYPPEVFIGQFEKVAGGFENAHQTLVEATQNSRRTSRRDHWQNLVDELTIAEAAAIHFRTTANQARFVRARRALAGNPPNEGALLAEIEQVLRGEIELARRLYALQSRDSRIGFEASNHYYYVPLDLVEKVLNCQDLLERGLPVTR